MFLERSIELHRLRIEPALGKPVGAFGSDVVALEARMGVVFSKAYREYLQWMGADFDGLLRGSDCFITHVEENGEALAILLKENNFAGLSYKPIVFFIHQGYSACWFDASDHSDDPTVFCFSEGSDELGIHACGAFSDWIYNELLALSKAIQ